MEKILIRNIDLERWKNVGRRVLVYGRRKTGKTFFISRFTKWDEYFFVKRDGSAFDIKNRTEISYDTLKDVLIREKGKTIVIDEFHRLPDDFLDFLQAYSEDMNLILITSTLWLSRKIIDQGSPILGLFQEFRMDLIDERDAIAFTLELGKKEAVDMAIYIREPWVIPLIKDSIYDSIPRILIENKNTIERLVGEVFREEERELKKTYVSILFAIASGKSKSSEISSYMYSRKVIPKDDPSIIQGYLRTLCNIGLIEKLHVLNKRFDLYIHKSPILDLYFYMDAKYGFSEVDMPEKEVKKIFMEKLPFHAEQFIRNLISKVAGLKGCKIVEKNYDIDIALVSFKKLIGVGEVKWKRKIEKEDIRKSEDILRKFNVKKFVVVPNKDEVEYESKEVEILDIMDILNRKIF